MTAVSFFWNLTDKTNPIFERAEIGLRRCKARDFNWSSEAREYYENVISKRNRYCIDNTDNVNLYDTPSTTACRTLILQIDKCQGGWPKCETDP